MKAWGIAFWISVGGFLECQFAGAGQHFWTWMGAMLVSLLGWGWTAIFTGGRALLRQGASLWLGRPLPLPRTDPRALAEETAALNAQLAQLRDTATSFDVSFDQTLQRMDERLRRVEQQSSYLDLKQRG